jgi:hypothetical protein
VLFGSAEGVEVGEELFLIRHDEVFVECLLHVFESYGHAEVPTGFFAAVEAGRLGFDADDIAVFLGFFQQRLDFQSAMNSSAKPHLTL